MSYGISFVAKNKASAVTEVQKLQEQQKPHFPKPIADAIVAHIDLLPDNCAVFVEAHGHFDKSWPTGSSGKLDVRGLAFVE